MDPRQLRRLYRMAKKLDQPDASALIRQLVGVIVAGNPERRRVVLGDLSRRLDEFDGERAGQLFFEAGDASGESETAEGPQGVVHA